MSGAPHSYRADIKAVEIAMTQFAQCVSVLAGNDMTRAEVMVAESRPALIEGFQAMVRLAERGDGPSLRTKALDEAADLVVEMMGRWDDYGDESKGRSLAEAIRALDATNSPEEKP